MYVCMHLYMHRARMSVDHYSFVFFRLNERERIETDQERHA